MSRPSHAIVVAASAGGLEPLERLVEALPADLVASVFVVHHTGRQRRLPGRDSEPAKRGALCLRQ